MRKRSDSNTVLTVRKRSDSNMVLSVRKRSDSNNNNTRLSDQHHVGTKPPDAIMPRHNWLLCYCSDSHKTSGCNHGRKIV
ncbi:hypothetical protein [Lysinibacillus sp. NPDC056232]|uniref:hypothetical protein n=1 Tax=Lysinibacillus sp. NPDC056232 TaxID=3345756 RepID=UPI0035D99AC4